MTPEGAIKNSICSWLSFQKCFFWVADSVGIFDPTRGRFRENRNRYRIKGVSDILGIWKGRPLAIEVKIKGRYPSREQRAFLDRFNAEGGIGIVARSIEDVERALESFSSNDDSISSALSEKRIPRPHGRDSDST